MLRPDPRRTGRRLRGEPLAAFLLATALAACASAAGEPGAAPEAAVTSAAAAPATPDTGALRRADPPELPDPDAPIPKNAARVAKDLTETTAALHDAIDTWVDGGAKTPPPEPVTLLALHHQRIHRALARRPALAERVFDRLPARLARSARDNVTAIRGLLSLARPTDNPNRFKIRPPLPPRELMRHFKRAERRFGVDWEVLAAVMFVETKFGRVRSPSHTGAKGPMQFMPRTWEAYGMGGDIHDTGDAVLAAANYLRASGAPRDYRRALYAYNHSYAYVDAVQAYARQIKRDRRAYYTYYNWQVFILTPKGERRVSGPGID